MDTPVTGLGGRLRTAVTTWRPRTPLLADDLARRVGPVDPEWFARELAIAAARPVVVLDVHAAPLLLAVDLTPPTAAVAAYPGGVVPDDVPEARIG